VENKRRTGDREKGGGGGRDKKNEEMGWWCQCVFGYRCKTRSIYLLLLFVIKKKL